MKKYLLLLLFFPISISLFSQVPKNSNWVYRVQYDATTELADSFNTFTKVFIDINSLAVVDSSALTFSIADSAGGNELLRKQIVYTSSLVNDSNIIKLEGGIRFFLGKYVILGKPLNVGLHIELPQKAVSNILQ